MERWLLVILLSWPTTARAQSWTEVSPPESMRGDLEDPRTSVVGCGVWDGVLYLLRQNDVLVASTPTGEPSWRVAYQSDGSLRSITVHPTLGVFVVAEASDILHAHLTHFTVELHHVNPDSGQAANRVARFGDPFVDAEGYLAVFAYNGPAFRRGDDGTWERVGYRELLETADAWGSHSCGPLWGAFADGTPVRGCYDEDEGETVYYTVSRGRWRRFEVPVEHPVVELGFVSPTLMTSYIEDRRNHVWLRRARRWQEVEGPDGYDIGGACTDGTTLYALAGRHVYRRALR